MNKERPEPQPVVFVVDDDASVRDALKSLFRSVGLRAETFASAADCFTAICRKRRAASSWT